MKARVTPFVYGERFNLNDVSPNNNRATVYAAGINIKPYPSVVLNLEFDRLRFDDTVGNMPDGTPESRSNGVLDVYTSHFCSAERTSC
jgi:hypothetical protein